MSIFKRTGRGFTLIELLVVIAIIGILSSVVLASLNDARTKSRDAKRIADLKQVQLALELYFDANGSYPTAMSAVSPTYMATVPADPLAGHAYTYAAIGSASTCTSYHLGAALEQATNTVLQSDTDAAVNAGLCTGSTDFTGLSANAASCNATAGTAQPGGTEVCYDIKP